MVAFFVALLVVSVIVYSLEAAWGRAKVNDYVRRQGWTPRSIRWQPRWPSRQARFRIVVERDGDSATGTAVVGGGWTGPVWSRVMDVEWDPT